MTKRVLALLMVMAMMLSLVPAVVTAEEAAATPGYTLIMQKAHNQTDGSLAVDVYLQANTAEQGDVTAYDFVVTPAEGLELALPVDATGNNGLAFNGETGKLVYDGTTAPAIPVETDKVLVANLTVSGETLPANVADAITLSEVTVSTAAGFYSDDANDAATEGYAGTVAQLAIVSACDDHACKHGEGTWTAFTATKGELAAGNYYLTSDVQLTGTLTIAADAEVSICLNGFDMTAMSGTRMIEANKTGITLNICDCTASGEGADYTAGKLIPTHNHGGALRASYAAEATINFFGGVIDGCQSSKKEASVALIYGGSTLNMLGGLVEGFDAGLTSGGFNYGPIIIRGDKDGNEAVANITGVTFNNCGSAIVGAPYGTNSGKTLSVVTMKDVTVLNSAADAHAVAVADHGNFKSVTIEGNCKFDAPVYIAEGETVTLNLGENADVNIVTDEELTEEQFNECVKMAEGGSLADGVLLYENAGVFVSYDAEAGKFVFMEGHAHDGVVFKVWDKTDSLPAMGNWYLLNDVTITEPVAVEKTLNLDLNGKTVTSGNGARFFDVWLGTLNLYDCAESYDADGNWIGGKLTGSTADFGSVNVRTGGTFNMYGGQLYGNGTDGATHNGGAIYLYNSQSNRNYNGAVFNMYGGEISGNKAGYYGSAISTKEVATVPEGKEPAQINLIGGKICDNVTKTADAAKGYGVIRTEGTAVVNMSGTEIVNNEAKNGAAFYLAGNSVVNISGGKIVSNATTAVGGGIYAGDKAKLYITGGEFLENTASSGAFLAFEGTNTIEISNATIADNTSAGGGGAIYCGGTSSLTITNCTITGNTATKGTGSAIYHRGTTTLKLVDTIITGNNCADGGTWYCGAIYTNTSSGKIILSGRTVIDGNTGGSAGATNPLAQNIVFQGNLAAPKVYVDELSAGAHIEIYNLSKDGLTADALVNVATDGSQTDWSCGWITYYETTNTAAHTYNAVAGKNVSRVNGAFTFGHWHTDADGNAYELTAWTSTTALPESPAAGETKAYYLTANVAVSSDANKLQVDNGSLELCTNGYDITAGATGIKAFRTNNGTLKVIDCTASYDANGHLLIGSKVSGFQSNGNGAVFCAISGNTTSSTFIGLEFADNYDTQRTASLGYGGNLTVRAQNSLYVDGCKFTNNKTLSGGGAIQVQGASGKVKTVEITNSVFEGNHALHNGGAISLAGAASGTDVALIENCKFIGNYTTTYAASDATAAGSDSGRGGAIFINKATANVTNCEFVNNKAIHNPDVTETLTNNAQGGAIYVAYSSKLTLDNDCTFTGNHSDQFGGAVFSYIANTYAGTYKNNTSDDHGGAICQYDGNATIASGAVFEGNTAVGGGGAIFHRKGLTVSNATFKGNSTSGGQGGAIFSELAATATATIKDGCTFEGNTAPLGGAIGTETGSYTLTLSITGGSFKNNTVPTNKWSLGGAMRLGDNTKATISGVTFDGNQSQLGGVFYTSESGGAITATDCVFTNNYASSRGGVGFFGWGGAMKFDGCTFDGNSTVNHGGVFHSEGNSAYSLTIGATKACTFTNNSAKYGGAISAVSGNNASVNTPAVKIYNSTFTGNTGSSGGAIYTGNGLHASNAGYPIVTVSGCTIRENTASSDGAALSITGSSQVTMSDTTIENNTDAGYFSAVFVQTAASKLTLSGKMVIANNAGNSYPVADLHFRDTTALENNPTVTFNGLTAGSKIGISATNGRYNTLPVVGTITLAEGTTYADVAGYFFSDNEDRYITHVTDAGELMLTNYVAEDGTAYQTLNEAIAAAVANGETTFVLQAGNKADKTDVELGGNLTIDLNGKDISKIVVADGYKLSLIDSKTNDYDVADGVYGQVVIEGDYDTYYEDNTNGLKRYVVVTDAEGISSAHRVYLAINKKVLRTANAGIGFKAIFAGDQVVEEYITGYGLKVWKTEDPDSAKYADFMHYEFENGIGNGAPNQVTAVVKNVLEKGNAENQARFETGFTGMPVITIGEGEDAIVIEGKTVATSMYQIAKNNSTNADVQNLLTTYSVTIQ